MRIEVARVGQRPLRDDRVTTHAALVARAFGASRIYMNEATVDIPQTLHSVNETWGGDFEVILADSIYDVVRKRKADSYCTIHLSMYGESLDDVLPRIQVHDRILVVIGASKVPRSMYEVADYNVAVGHQPHSEIAALAVFLDRLQNGAQLNRIFEGGRQRIIPIGHGKMVVSDR